MAWFKKFVLTVYATVLPAWWHLYTLQRFPNWPRRRSSPGPFDEFYTDEAFAYWDDVAHRTLSPVDVQKLIADLPDEPMTVLFVGCGRKLAAIDIGRARKSARVTGIDTDPAVVSQANATPQRPPNVTFQEMSVAQLHFPDGTFDWVLCIDVLCHLPADDRNAALCEFFRVLKPGGKLVLGDWVATTATPPNIATIRQCPDFWTAEQYEQVLCRLMLSQTNFPSDRTRFQNNLNRWIAHIEDTPAYPRIQHKLELVFLRYVLWLLQCQHLGHVWVVGEKKPARARTPGPTIAG